MFSSPVNYRFIKHEVDLSKDPTGILYEYLMTGSGVFIRGHRPGLALRLLVASAVIRGLLPVEPLVTLEYPIVPQGLITQMLDTSRHACGEDGSSVEALFYLSWQGSTWELVMPAQKQERLSVRPLGEALGSPYEHALIEVHSHHRMKAFFSATDDLDEVGFRIYAVLGDIYCRPAIRVRVGLYGYRMEVPASQVFALPDDVVDARSVRER